MYCLQKILLVRPTAPLQNKKGKNLIREIVKTGRTDILSLIPQKVKPEFPVPSLFVRLPKESSSSNEFSTEKTKKLRRLEYNYGRTDILSLIPQKVHPEVQVPELFVRLPKETISFHESSTEKTKKLKSLEYNYEKELNNLQLKYERYRAINKNLYEEQLLLHRNETKDKQAKILNNIFDFHEIEKKELKDLQRKHCKDLLRTMFLLAIPICPICFEGMSPLIKIFQCTNGHVVCETCRQNLSICPYCRKEFMGRAIGLEQHLRSMQIQVDKDWL